jgi:arylsulfatase A-like enzyme
LKKTFFYILITHLCFISCNQKHDLKKPNIIYVLADDLGYGDIKVFNTNGKINTPNIDQLASEGMIFTDAHSSSSVCTPTRYGILTGRYNWRSKLKKSVLNGTSKALISKKRTTIASLLKNNGYDTGFIGKWHLGWNWSLKDSTYYEDRVNLEKIDLTNNITHGPNDLGFDYSYGHSGSLDMPPYVYVENEKITGKINRIIEDKGEYSWFRKGPTAEDFIHDQVTPHFFNKAHEFIKEKHEEKKPFFLYLPLPSPHTPILPTKDWKGKSGLNEYADFVMQIDHHMGELDNFLKELNISDNTMIVFTSDNGCSPEANFKLLAEKDHYPSGLYRGFKAGIFEGAHRVPFIIKWPKKIIPGSVSEKTICTTDFMGTLADILNVKLDDDEGVDSFSMLPLFSNESEVNYGREFTIHHSINGSFAIRKDDFKFIFTNDSGGWSYPRAGSKDGEGLPKFQFYNLKIDPGETKNLYGNYPEVENNLIDLFKKAITNGRTTVGNIQKNDLNFPSKEEWNPLLIFE